MLSLFCGGVSAPNLNTWRSLKWYTYTTLYLHSHEIYFTRWYLILFQGQGRLALLTPFLSSITSSHSQKKFFSAVWLLPLPSFLQGTPRGSVVILLMISGVSSMERSFTTVLAWVLVSGMREREKYLATSSSYHLNFSKKAHPIMPCEYLQHRRVLMNPHCVNGFPIIKSPYHFYLMDGGLYMSATKL